jgi:exonuclease SbcC
MTDRFNEHLRSLVSRNLPRFTNGRYEYLQVGDDLQVRVYSNEKRSFLDLEEISSGTQRQITLALRLALAQEQMSRIAKDRQFAFLDEPFAFFDDTRMRGALRLLPELSDHITQHWVVAQRFPRDEFLALGIPCASHSDTLEIGLTGGGRGVSPLATEEGK